MKLLPCPFCQGPPAHFTCDGMTKRPFEMPDEIPDDGLCVEAFVFCHECGAQSEKAEDFCAIDMADVTKVKDEAARLWNLRDSRHRDLYESNAALGQNEYPRPGPSGGTGL